MKCPYNMSLLKHIEQSENNIINEELGICKGTLTNIFETYKWCDCIKEDCAVYYDGKCHYNG